MKYSNFDLDDFLSDEFFKNWVIQPDDESDYFWESYLDNNPDKYNTLIRAKEIILSLSFETPANDELSEYEIEAILSTSIQHPSATSSDNQDITKQRSLRPWEFFSKVAAILIISSAVGIVWFQMNFDSIEVQEQVAMNQMIKRTAKGEKMTVRLPDNSVAILNANSQLEFPQTFSSGKRQLILTGEAFFDVVEDSDRPFIVQSGNFSTQVKGTSFAIRKDKSSKTVKVSVATGIVEVKDKDQNKIEIEAGEMALYNPIEGNFNKKEFDYYEMIAWKDGLLHFKDSDFNEILVKLENWYGVNFEIKKSIDRKKDFSGHFNNQNLDLVLHGISFVYGFDFEIEGNNVIIN